MSRYFALLSIGLTGLAAAQIFPPFERVDANRDGRVSALEAAAVEWLDFRKADANRDGTLSRLEYDAQKRTAAVDATVTLTQVR
jgi:hypothetical protein